MTVQTAPVREIHNPTTSSELAAEEGVSVEAISKQVRRFRDAGQLRTERQGRAVVFDRERFAQLRRQHADPAHTRLDFGSKPAAEPAALPTAEPGAPDGAAAPADAGAAAPSTPDADNTASAAAALRYQINRARNSELQAQQAEMRLMREAGSLVAVADVERRIATHFGPLRAMMIDQAADLARVVLGAKDVREGTKIIRDHFAERLNSYADRLEAAGHEGLANDGGALRGLPGGRGEEG